MYRYRARVISVYDGDTITVDIDLGFNLTRSKVKIRLANIDTPEIRGDQRDEGLKARDALREKILQKDVIVETIKDKTGKYGRYLGIIWLDEENVNQWLISEGYAEKYPPTS